MSSINLLAGFKLNENGLLVRDGSPVARHLESVPSYLPFIGQDTPFDLFSSANDPSPIIDEIYDRLNKLLDTEELINEGGWNLEFEKSFWKRVQEPLFEVERFRGDADLKNNGGNVGEHTLFSTLLFLRFLESIIEKQEAELSSHQKKSLANFALDTTRAILVHDVGEWPSEFGTLNQENAGLIDTKDFNPERDLAKFYLQLAFYAEHSQEGEALFNEVIRKSQAQGKQALHDADNFEDKSERQGYLTEQFLQIRNDVEEICKNLSKNCKNNPAVTTFMNRFDAAEEYKDFSGIYARLMEKLEGSLHLLILLNKGCDVKIIGGNHTSLSIQGTAGYNESSLNKLYARLEESDLDGVIGLSLANNIKTSMYHYMATYCLAATGNKNATASTDKHDPLKMAYAYSKAADIGFKPSPENPIIARMDDLTDLLPSHAELARFKSDLSKIGVDLGKGVSMVS